MPIRPAHDGDFEFLLDMLLAAVNWTGPRFSREQVMADPHLSGYVAEWPRAGDFGLVAESGTGQRLGAAWARTFAADSAGYGFVAEGIPEVAMAVVPAHRGRGIGRGLLTALIEQAGTAGLAALSLSVEDGNRVVALYRELGFRAVDRNDNADTMVLDLRA